MTAETADREAEKDLKTRLLAVRCQLGEPAAFDELVALLHLRLWGYLLRLVGERGAAEDALQETWLRVVRDLPRLREPARLVSWIFGIAHNVAVDSLRRRRVTLDLDVEEVRQLAVAEEDPDDFRQHWSELETELLGLPFALREVLTLFYLEDLPMQKIAEIANVPTGTVKSRLFRAAAPRLAGVAARRWDG